MHNASNVIKFIPKAKVPPAPQQEELPWHIQEALWIQQHVEKFNLSLSVWETAFVKSMSTWTAEASERQEDILQFIADRIEKTIRETPEGPDAA